MRKAFCELHGRGYVISEGCLYCDPPVAKSDGAPDAFLSATGNCNNVALPARAPIGAFIRLLNKQVCPMSISPPGGERVICQPGCLPLLRAQLSCGVASKHVDFDGRDVWHLYGDLVLA